MPSVLPLSKLGILIVDPDSNNRSLLQERLRQITGWVLETFTAPDSKVAFSVLKDHLIDVIFLDYHVDGAGGLRLLDQLRQMHPRTAVVIMTSRGDEKTAAESLKRGAIDYIGNFHTVDLAQVLRRAVETQTLQNENAELRQVNQAKDDFVATVSHELRTPLAVILGYARAMEEEEFGPLSDQQRKAAKAIRLRGQQLLQMVNRMLAFKETLSGMQSMVLKPVELAAFLNNYLDTHWSAPSEKHLVIERHIPTTPVWVLVDAHQFREVLQSLMSNAAKFSVADERITITLSARQSREVWLSIQDRGRGIPPEALPRLFEGFFHADKTLTRDVPGLGIGLALARKIMDLHGGRIWLESSGAGKGTTGYVSLPVVEQDTPHVLVEHPPHKDKKRLLIVEDDPNTIEVMRLFLAGYSENLALNTAPDGEQALESLHESEYDLIILDIKLPNMTGQEIIDKIKELPHTKRMPILVVTGYQEAARRAISRGADDFLIKPFDRKVFLHKTLKLLGMERRSSLRS